MPDQPAEPTPTPVTEPVPAPEPQQPSPDQQLAVALAEQRASQAEQMAYQAGQQANYATQVAMNANRQPFVDPLDRLSKDDMIMTPEEKKRHLAGAIEGRARAIAQQQDQHFEQRLAQERYAMEANMAIQNAFSSRPELNDPRNQPNFVASMAKAKAIAESQGQNISHMELVRRAGQVYDTDYGQTRRTTVPYVEGHSRPDMNQPQGAPQVPLEKSKLEKLYGRKAGGINEIPDDWQSENMNYLRAKNKPLFDRGAVTSLEEVRATVAEQE